MPLEVAVLQATRRITPALLPLVLAGCIAAPVTSESPSVEPTVSPTLPAISPSPIVSPSPGAAGPEGRIAFLRRPGADPGQTDIFMVRPDGSDLIQVTNDSKRELLLYWLRDGSRLLFVWSDAVDPNDGRGHVASVLPDGSDRKELGRVLWMPSEPAVSPDGQRVAFGGDADPAGGSGIVLLDLVSGTRSRLTSDGAYAPRWSPDGTRLLAGVIDRVLVVDAATGKRLAKIDDPGLQETVGWTPDGASILYKSCLPQMNKLQCMANPVAIADSDGSNVRPFTGAVPSPVKWVPSPDRAWLAVGEDDGTTYLAAAAEPDARVALATGGAPAWSPDSAWLVLAAPMDAPVPSDEPTPIALWVVPRAGGTPAQITSGPNDAGAAWSPR